MNDSGRNPPGALEELHSTAQRIAANVERVLVGKPEVVRIALAALRREAKPDPYENRPVAGFDESRAEWSKRAPVFSQIANNSPGSRRRQRR